ncbi:odorant receptor 131-2-like [Diretmus argenteus]
MRYIFFAMTLMSDSFFLMLSNILLILSYFGIRMQVWLCLIIYIVISPYNFITPVTLTAMTLERYVAICMPLRHGELCTLRNTLHCILIINGISIIPILIALFLCFAAVTYSFYTPYRMCSVERFIIHRWQGHLRSAVHQLYFLIMAVIILFAYVKMIKVAKVASGENKKSKLKGVRTVTLHAFQLLLCLIQLWCPLIEAAALKIDVALYINVRYFDYLTFILAPRCLSPLIYGLRDKSFFLALKHFFGLNKKILILHEK